MIYLPIPNGNQQSNLYIRLRETLDYFEKITGFVHGDIVIERPNIYDDGAINKPINRSMYRVSAFIGHDPVIYNSESVYIGLTELISADRLLDVHISNTMIGVSGDDSIVSKNMALNYVHYLYYETLCRFKQVGSLFE